MDPETGEETERNPLYDVFPQLYLNGVLRYMMRYVMDMEKAQYYDAMFVSAINEVEMAEHSDAYAGGTLKVIAQ